MFEYCNLEKKKCGFAGSRDGIQYCGMATSVNKIHEMKECPLPKLQGKTKQQIKKQGL